MERPKVFFSSRMAVEPLKSLRADLHRRWEQGSGSAWVPELAHPEKLLESGVEWLRKQPPSGFTVRALRKLSLFYTVTLRRQRSREVLAEAYGLATKLGLQDQIDQIRRMPGGGRGLGQIPSNAG